MRLALEVDTTDSLAILRSLPFMKTRRLEVVPAVGATVACISTAAAGLLGTSPCTTGECTRCGSCLVVIPVAAACVLLVWVERWKRA